MWPYSLQILQDLFKFSFAGSFELAIFSIIIALALLTASGEPRIVMKLLLQTFGFGSYSYTLLKGCVDTSIGCVGKNTINSLGFRGCLDIFLGRKVKIRGMNIFTASTDLKKQ